MSILFLLPKLSLCEALAWGQVFIGGRLWKTLLPPDELLKIPERLKRCGNFLREQVGSTLQLGSSDSLFTAFALQIVLGSDVVEENI